MKISFRRTLFRALVLAFAALAYGQFAGAIYASPGDGTIVDQDSYAAKSGVYLSGGPQNNQGSGRPAGYYYFHLSSPNGGTASSESYPTTNAGCYIDYVGGTNPAQTNLDSGSDCRLTGAGTIGLCRNKIGSALITPPMLAGLVNLNLRDGSGADFSPASVKAEGSWLQDANAVYMGYMLSAQMSATWLNVASGKIPNANVYFPYTDSLVAINTLINYANGTLLATPGNCNDPNRTECEAYKNIFDTINNNQAVLGPGSCPVVYPQ